MISRPVYKETDEAPFNLTVNEAKTYVKAHYQNIIGYGNKEYLDSIWFSEKDVDGHYTFIVETNESYYYVSLDPKTADYTVY